MATDAVNDIDRLNDLLSAFVDIRVALALISEHLEKLQRETEILNLHFGKYDGQFVGASYKSEPGRVIPASELSLLGPRTNCEYLPQYVNAFYRGLEDTQRAIQSISGQALAHLNALNNNKPWRPMVRRECLNKLKTWPGDRQRVPEHPRSLLSAAAARPPFDTWNHYLELVDGYMDDIRAIGGEVSVANFGNSADLDDDATAKKPQQPRAGQPRLPVVRSDAKSATIEWPPGGVRYPVSHAWAAAFQKMIGAKGVPVGIGGGGDLLRKPADDLKKLKAEAPELAAIVQPYGKHGYRLTVFAAGQ